jgi:hypothetical protein
LKMLKGNKFPTKRRAYSNRSEKVSYCRRGGFLG